MECAIRGAAILCGVLAGMSAWADPPPVAQEPAVLSPAPYTAFSPRFVGPPKPGTTKFITVQIDPVEQAAALARPTLPQAENPIPRGGADPSLLPATPEPAGPVGSYAWFWDNVSPQLGDGAGRFPLALENLTKGPDGKKIGGPRLQSLQDIAQLHGAEILKATVDKRVSPALVLAVIAVESAGRADAVSSAGAQGLMQLIPATADRFGVSDAKDPAQNIGGGVAYLDWLMREFDGDPLMVLAAYNAGENAVKSAGGVPPYAETRDYVPKVLAAWAVARGLCLTPPELVSDGCVFATRG